jgi:hypothetical protein
VLCSLQNHLRTRTHDLDHPILAVAENTDNFFLNDLRELKIICLKLFTIQMNELILMKF